MDTECDVDRSAGRGFNISALYALLMLVHIEKKTRYPKTLEMTRISKFYKPKGTAVIVITRRNTVRYSGIIFLLLRYCKDSRLAPHLAHTKKKPSLAPSRAYPQKRNSD